METENIVRIELERIEPSPGNRKVGGFDQAKLQQLAESIKAVGVQQPAIVRPKGAGQGDPIYELVAGERRWRASKLAGVPDLPCVIRELDDVQVLKIQTIENLQREDVHPLDEADGYARLIDAAGYTIEQVAGELGKSISYVYQRLKLRDLIPEARKLLVKNRITESHAILIARLTEAQQKEIVEDYLFESSYAYTTDEEKPISVRELSDTIQERLFMELSHATWPLDDADLVSAVGACKVCLKRSGAQPDLFADVCKDNKKKDQCIDRACFYSKIAAIVKRRRSELKGSKYFAACGSYTSDKPKDAASSYEWTECKKNEPKAQCVLIVAGNGAGRVTWGVDGRSRAAENSQAKREEEERKEKAEMEKQTFLRRRIYDAIAKELKGKRIGSLLQQGLLDGILAFILDRTCRQSRDDLEGMIVAEGWGEKKSGYCSRPNIILKKMKGLDAHELLILLLKTTISEFLAVERWHREDLKPVEVLAASLGVDVKAITAAVTAELKALPAPAGADSPGGPSPKRKRSGR
jgi:ParB/RepB/Spo0J family partition protein